MEFKLVFNNSVFKFPEDFLSSVYKYIWLNETLNDDDELLTLSFISKSIIRKYQDDLDYHEFVLMSNIRVSNLVRNIYSAFGKSIAEKFAQYLSEYWDEEIDTDSTDWFDSVSAHVANDMAKSIFSEKSDLLKFQRLLALLHLYDCVLEDYEQLDTDYDSEHNTNGYRGLLNINGIVVKCIDRENQVILKPVFSMYDTPISEYIDMSGFLVPQAVLNAVLNPFHCYNSENDIKPNCSFSDFLLFVEQLTGLRLSLPKPKVDISSCCNDDRLFGKWFHIDKDDVPWEAYTVIIDWFKNDGHYKRSIVFCSRLNEATSENWLPQNLPWHTKDNTLYIAPNEPCGSTQTYKIENNVLYLDNTRKFYRSLDDAIKNL